jgi:hypothetical protein
MAGTRLIARHYTDASTANDASDDIYQAIVASTAANDCAATSAIPCSWSAQFVDKDLADIGPVLPTNTLMPNGTLGVRVAVRRQPGTFISHLVGIHSWDVNTEATAIASKFTSAPPGQLIPIALKSDPNPDAFVPGQVYDLTDGKDTPGGFGYISWTGSNDPNSLADSICNPNNPPFTFPATFPIDPGKSNSSGVRSCLDDLIDSGKTVLVPIYDVVTCCGNGATYRIIGVAAFVLTSRAQPAVDNIQGYFVGIYPYPSVPGGLNAAPPDPGDTSLALGLVR